MANEEALGPRKTMFVLVIVVGCFAVLWPRILSPLILGSSKDQLKPNQFDRDAGCCEVLFDSEVAVLEVLNEVCNSIVHVSGKLSPYAAAECRKTVNETCGVDIASFLRRDENVGKTTKRLLDTMKSSNSSCLKEHFGVPILSLSSHTALNSWTLPDSVKQERPALRGGPGPHPALRERGRAIPAGAPTPPSRGPVAMPAHMRVRSPLQGYFELDIKPPPIPGMRPPLGSPGGPVAAPKSSMGFVMPIYTICIIVFFVYTLSKILFKRTASPYDQVIPDPQFRRRVFRDDSRTTPDKLGDLELEELRARLAETERAMQKIVGQLAARDADAQQDNNHQARPYTNGTIIHNTGPVHIVASEYHERAKTPEPDVTSKETKESSPGPKEASPEPKEASPEPKEASPEPKEASLEPKEVSPEPKEVIQGLKEASPKPKEVSPEPKEVSPEPKEVSPEPKEVSPEPKEVSPEPKAASPEPKEEEEPIKLVHKEALKSNHVDRNNLIKLSEPEVNLEDSTQKSIENFLNEARIDSGKVDHRDEKTSELLEEALREDSPEEHESSSVKVLGMETRAHAADGGAWPSTAAPPPAAPAHKPEPPTPVSSIFLSAHIPQQSRLLVADFAEDRDQQPVDSPLVVSGKMTLSLIQDEPRDTPERDLESTFDDFTTASAMTQAVAEKEDDLPNDEEEILIEEVEVEEDDEVKEEEIKSDEEVVDEEYSEEEVEEIEVEVTDSEEEVEENKPTVKK